MKTTITGRRARHSRRWALVVGSLGLVTVTGCGARFPGAIQTSGGSSSASPGASGAGTASAAGTSGTDQGLAGQSGLGAGAGTGASAGGASSAGTGTGGATTGSTALGLGATGAGSAGGGSTSGGSSPSSPGAASGATPAPGAASSGASSSTGAAAPTGPTTKAGTSSGHTASGGTATGAGATTAGAGGACTGGSTVGISGNTINIALLVPKTGAAPVPPTIDQETQAYWNYINSRGGIHGMMVQTHVLDTGSTSSGAEAEVTQASSQDLAVITLDRIFIDQAVERQTQQLGIPDLLVQTAGTVPASEDWEFDIGVNQDTQGATIADYFAHVLHAHKVGVVHENDPTLLPGTTDFVNEAKKDGLDVVNQDTIDGNSSNQTQESANLANDKADAEWLYVAPNNAISIINESHNDGLTKTALMSSAIAWAFNLTLAATPAGAANNAHGFSLWPALTDPRAKTAESHLPSPDPGPTSDDLGLAGWGYGQIVANALQNVQGKLTRNSFRCALQGLKLSGTSPVDGGPFLWSPVSFGPGVRMGVADVIPYNVGMVGLNAQWVPAGDYAPRF